MRFIVTTNFHLQTIICDWWLKNLWMMYNPVIKILLYLFTDLWVPFLLLFQCPWCISVFNCLALRFSSSNLTISIFFTSKVLVNIHSYFCALGFLNGDYVMGDIGMLLVNPSGVETIETSRIFLNCCWSSHLPACLHIFLCFQDIYVHV